MQTIHAIEHWINIAALIGLAVLLVLALVGALDWVARGAGTTRARALGVMALLTWLIWR